MSDTRFDKKRTARIGSGESQKERKARKSGERCEKVRRSVGPLDASALDHYLAARWAHPPLNFVS
jgi:hypothetical protein